MSDFSDWVVAATFSPDGRTIVAGSYDSICVVDVDTQTIKATTDTGAGFATSLAFSPDGKNLAVGCYQAVLLCDAAGTVQQTLKEHRGQVTSVCFSKDGDQLLTGGDDEAIRIWNWRDGKCLQTIKDFDQPVQAARFSTDGQLIAVATGDTDRPTRKGKVHLLKPDGTRAHKLEDHRKSCDRMLSLPPMAICCRPALIKLRTSTASSPVKLLDFSEVMSDPSMPSTLVTDTE